MPTSERPIPVTTVYSPFSSVSTLPASPPWEEDLSAASRMAAMAFWTNRTSADAPILPIVLTRSDDPRARPYI